MMGGATGKGPHAAPAPTGAPTLVPHRCLGCGAGLERCPDRMQCPSCGAAWPLVDGVASYGSAKYFGEIGEDAMERLVAAARAGHWREAARSWFENAAPEMYQYVVDLNRAAWIPLLPLGPESTVLDVGCGLGAVTHALALAYRHVVAVEPIPARVHFTQVRCEQEALTNVEVVQATVEALPLFDGTFDLIVLNGILEWVGEWRTEGSPRAAQLDTLRALRRRLRPGGLAVIGIENRIGLSSFFNRVDHSGLRYTSLMPRAVASLYVKLRRPGFYRTAIDPAGGYRTYTYSPRGYARLLAEAGFASTDLWWPPDGYNRPHALVRLGDAPELTSHYLRLREYKDRVQGPALRRAIKEWLVVRSGLGRAVLPDDVLVVAAAPGPRPDGASLMGAVVRAAGARGHAALLKSHELRNKSVIKLVDGTGAPVAIAKVANVRAPGADAIEQGFGLLTRLRETCEPRGGVLRGSIPAPIELVRVGSLVASVEGPARGMMLQDLSMARGYFSDRARVRRHLELVASWLIAVRAPLAELAAGSAIRELPPSWRVGPDRAANTPEAPNAPETPADGTPWIQHGDFFPENVFVDEAAGAISVIDWDNVGSGYPPLFDWFCLVTGMYYTGGRVRLARGETVDRTSFVQTYFEPHWFAEIVGALTDRICVESGLDRARVGDWFEQYLAVRWHQFQGGWAAEGPLWTTRYREFHDFFCRNRERFVCGAGRMSGATAWNGTAGVLRPVS
jgi:SAM-dependent methyltransferase